MSARLSYQADARATTCSQAGWGNNEKLGRESYSMDKEMPSTGVTSPLMQRPKGLSSSVHFGRLEVSENSAGALFLSEQLGRKFREAPVRAGRATAAPANCVLELPAIGKEPKKASTNAPYAYSENNGTLIESQSRQASTILAREPSETNTLWTDPMKVRLNDKSLEEGAAVSDAEGSQFVDYGRTTHRWSEHAGQVSFFRPFSHIEGNVQEHQDSMAAMQPSVMMSDYVYQSGLYGTTAENADQAPTMLEMQAREMRGMSFRINSSMMARQSGQIQRQISALPGQNAGVDRKMTKSTVYGTEQTKDSGNAQEDYFSQYFSQLAQQNAANGMTPYASQQQQQQMLQRMALMQSQALQQQQQPQQQQQEPVVPISKGMNWGDIPRDSLAGQTTGILSNMPTILSANATLVDDAKPAERQMTPQELHAIGECQPCAYFLHKDDGCRQGDECTFCHQCDADQLRKKRKEKQKKIKQEMKQRKAEERAKKGPNDSPLAAHAASQQNLRPMRSIF